MTHNSTKAVFNGINLYDLGIYVVNMDSGLLSSPFLHSQDISEDYAINNDTPYYYGRIKQPLSLRVVFSRMGDLWTDEKRREFASIIDVDNYVPFYFVDEETLEKGKMYYVIHNGGSELFDNGVGQGYVEINFQCDSPYAYLEEVNVVQNCSTTEITNFSLTNSGDIAVAPEFWIRKSGAGNIKIENITSGKTLVLTDLEIGETVYVNNEDGTIDTTIFNVFRYQKHNGVYLSLLKGANQLKVTGKCTLSIKYQPRVKG